MSQAPVAAPRALLPLAAVAVAFAAADTYVVVLCLPEMMGSVGLGIDQLQRAAPIISGFLLGYVAMLPLIGRVADLRGRVPVLVAALTVFALGSLVTASAYDLGSLVAGRFLQGLGGGGLVPVTLALVADLYAADRRSVPLGVVSGVQELGSVLGPLYGALVLAVGTWRDIFWVNLGLGLGLAGTIAVVAGWRPARRFDALGAVLLSLAVAGMLLVMRQPRALITSVRWGGPFVPYSGSSVWWSPIGVATGVVALLLLAWLLLAPAPLVDLRAWGSVLREADLVGAGLLCVVLAGVVLAFATADPSVEVLSAAGPWLLAVSAVAVVGFVAHVRRSARPLVPRATFARRPAWAALLINLFVGAALIAALVDVPIFARVTIASDSQLDAALVLVEFLIALPVGAVLGGFVLRRGRPELIASTGMLLATVGFVLMHGWGRESLHHPTASIALVIGGLGFGLVLAPINAALLAATPSSTHGIASALLVVSRMIGMLVGISALTTIGLRRYYAVSAHIPPPLKVCGGGSTRCSRYTHLLEHAGIEQLHAIFAGAALCALVAAILSLTLLRANQETPRA